MPKPSAISVFVAATSLLVVSAPALHAQDAGGLKEWTTDQAVDEESVLDADAAALKKKAEQEDICVPIGEGENLSLIHISEPTRRTPISYAVFCLKKKKK